VVKAENERDKLRHQKNRFFLMKILVVSKSSTLFAAPLAKEHRRQTESSVF
jgi:hypothetical protein